MELTLEGTTITAALQVFNSLILIPVFRYVVLIERRLTKIETTHELEKKAM